MSVEERQIFARTRIESALASEIHIGPPLKDWLMMHPDEALPQAYFIPSPRGSVLILPERVKNSPYVIKPGEENDQGRLSGRRLSICRFHTGVNGWKDSKDRTRFPV